MRIMIVAAVTAKMVFGAGPFDGQTFKGRIAYSSDGNHNDPDDWAASPVALAIFAEAGVKSRLVHFDYNSILPQTDPEWERTHTASVLGAVEHYGYNKALFYDCRKDVDAAVNSIAKAINASSADDPLYFIIAGPMEVPFRGIEKSEPRKRKFVYPISHSQWNDGFSPKYTFTHTKRSVIPSGVHWVQIQDQNRLLSRSRYGKPADPQEFEPYFWMRDSKDARVRFLWKRLVVSTRPDPSDAGMAYFLVTGDEQADPAKLEKLLEKHIVPEPVAERSSVRVEAENFLHFERYELEYRNDREASHTLNVRPVAGSTSGRIRTPYEQPYTAMSGRYDVDIRYSEPQGARSRFRLSINGSAKGESWQSAGDGPGWKTHTVRDVEVRRGDEIAVDVQADGGELARLDYVQLNTARSK